MKCKDCAEGRRFSAGSVYCIPYGMIIREDHECQQKGGRPRERDEDQREPGEDEAEIQGERGGAA